MRQFHSRVVGRPASKKSLQAYRRTKLSWPLSLSGTFSEPRPKLGRQREFVQSTPSRASHKELDRKELLQNQKSKHSASYSQKISPKDAQLTNTTIYDDQLLCNTHTHFFLECCCAPPISNNAWHSVLLPQPALVFLPLKTRLGGLLLPLRECLTVIYLLGYMFTRVYETSADLSLFL
jgi:hypothetical protein